MDDIHIHPVDDLIDHDIASRGCWCHPALDDECGTILVIHHSADGRERREPHARPPAMRH